MHRQVRSSHGLPPAPPLHFVSRCDLHDRALDSGARRVSGPARGPSGHSGGGRAAISGVASPPALRPRCARRRARSGRRRLPSRTRARWAPDGATGLDQHRVAQRQLPRLRGLHGDVRVRGGVDAAAGARAGPTHGGPVCGSRALALSPPADRRRVGRSGGGREPHPRHRAAGSASAVGTRPGASGRAAELSRGPARPDGPVLAGPLHSRRPAPGSVDFATGPELTPLLFYLAPVALVAWYAGRGPALGVACAGAIAWLLSDALPHGAYAHWSIPYWNGVQRLGALALVADIVARLHEAAARERDQARADPRTGVANLRAFYELAEAEIARARRYPHAFSVVYIDLDEFKLVNFRLGHEAGDAVLRSVARGLTGVLRASDVVARIGGDQFVVLLPEAGAAAARLTAEKLRQALSAVVPAHGWRITASIGVATFLVPPESVDALLAAADRLMYQAKQTGKNTVAHETQNEAPALR